MAHPVLSDPAVSVEVVVFFPDGEGGEERLDTRGIVESETSENESASLISRTVTVRIPDPGESLPDYKKYVDGRVSIPSIGVERYRISSLQPSGSALGSVGIDWRSLLLQVQAE